jgi:endonuclease/exonuclease/phosphatase family metal-dependent hydrolase
VALQEIRRGQARSLATTLGWQHVWTRKHHPWSPLAWWLAEGLAIMSPHELLDASRRTLTPGVSTWTNHHRIVLAATLRRNEELLRLYDIHLATGRRPDERISQAGRVASMIANERPAIAVVAGDFNGHGEAETIRPFHTVGLRDPGGGSTHPSMAPRQRLDIVLVPDAATAIDRFEPDGGDEWRELSDHIPVVVKFTINPSV